VSNARLSLCGTRSAIGDMANLDGPVAGIGSSTRFFK